MAIIEAVGLESAIGSEQVNSSGTTSSPTTNARSGERSLRVQATTTAIGYRGYGEVDPTGESGGFSLSTIYFSFAFMPVILPAANNEEFFVVTQGTNHRFGLRVNSAGNVLAYNRTGTLLATSTTALSLNTYYRISGNVVLGTTGSYSIKIRNPTTDAVLETLSGTGDTGTTNFTTIRYGKFLDRNGQSIEYFYDDIIHDDASEPGDWRIAMANPIADGSTQQWTSGTAPSNYTTIDEVPFSDTDYVMSTGAAGDVALFTFESMATLGISGATVKALKAHSRMREDAVTVTSTTVRIKSGATTADNTARDLTSTVVENSLIRVTDPNTSAAWTEAAVNAVEAGAREGNAVASRMTALGMMIVYDPSTIPTFKPIVAMMM